MQGHSTTCGPFITLVHFVYLATNIYEILNSFVGGLPVNLPKGGSHLYRSSELDRYKYIKIPKNICCYPVWLRKALEPEGQIVDRCTTGWSPPGWPVFIAGKYASAKLLSWKWTYITRSNTAEGIIVTHRLLVNTPTPSTPHRGGVRLPDRES